MSCARLPKLYIPTLLVLMTFSAFAQKDDEEKKKKWDITEPIGPTVKLEFDTSEGTWMNVDVSPDGKTIVFDLLGDVYVMSIEGSRREPATRLSSGAAFDMQPRFSPDGSLIAFTSDRDGAYNIWVMGADGKNPRQISKERERLVNSPSWSPDGQYIFVRKHFVKERSLGAGEIWMYHVGGSDGLQVTEKEGWQKDAGEPAISPDGKYLYYSKDVTPGQTFEYNKDPNGIIYAILRRDLTTGKEQRVVSRPGGSITPRPSPDGKFLAFIRRVRLKTVLFLKDLASGEERPLFDRLDRDLQEAWAIHGVYPQYAWTPDSRSIVIWGEGKIWKVPASRGRPLAVSARLQPSVSGPRSPVNGPQSPRDSKDEARTTKNGERITETEEPSTDSRSLATEVPFTVHVEQTINEALRFPQEVTSTEFPARMLRDVTTSPDGKVVVYSSLGRLYLKRLPDGKPSRVTKDSRFEFDPAFSPDGAWLAYTTWSDAERGRVRVVRLDGRDGRDIVRVPGHYAEPSFSPDGTMVVYRSTTPDNIRGLTHGENPGIFIVDVAKSGEPRLLRDRGLQPQFDHTGKRIYLRERRGEKFVLLSLETDGSDEVVHFQSDNATQVVPSPDGRWVAFAERYRAYVAAFPRSGRTIDLGPTVKAYPAAQISRDAGMYLHWSGDSEKVYWALGPELFSRDLSQTFTFLDRKIEKPMEPESKGIPIGFSVPSDVPTGAIALVGARVITMGADKETGVIENGTIVVDRNQIVEVGPSSAVRPPPGAKVIDLSGKTIIPGLIDVHAHVGGENDGILSESSWPLVANLSFGITTSHDPSNDTETVFTNAELIRAGLKLGPRLFSTGTILYGAETPFKAVVETYEDALSHLRRMKAVGAFSVKSYNQQRRDARQMIIKAGRELNMMVVPEGGSLLYMNETMVLDGHTGVEHALPVPVLYNDLVSLFGKSRTGYTPTLIVGYGGLSGEYYWYQHFNVWEHERLLRFVPREIVDARSRRRTMAPEDDFNHVRIAQGAKRIQDVGGLVQLGAHGQLQGLGAHWELWMLQQGGMTPLEALACATINGARYLGLDRDLGSLEKGKLADLVVLDKNPLENIRHTDSVRLVMVNGRLFDAETMNEIGNHPKRRRPFYWETSKSP